MKFLFGMIDGSGDRHILAGDAQPSLADMVHTRNSDACSSFDWGTEASKDSRLRTAQAILHAVVQKPLVSDHLIEEYANEVVAKMSPNVGWLLDALEVEAWVLSRTVC